VKSLSEMASIYVDSIAIFGVTAPIFDQKSAPFPEGSFDDEYQGYRYQVPIPHCPHKSAKFGCFKGFSGNGVPGTESSFSTFSASIKQEKSVIGSSKGIRI
jgi:hypothetical protein